MHRRVGSVGPMGSRWRPVIYALSAVFLVATAWYAFSAPSHPKAGSVDVGFLQDMRYHHDQAVQMSLDLLDKPSTTIDPVLRTIAKEVVVGQQLESGAMVQILQDWHQPDSNESGQAMGWMQHAVPLEEMNGMASTADRKALKAATGPDANALYAALMIVHHEGGIHMADYAADHAKADKVRVLAKAMVSAQKSDLVELRQIAARYPR